MYKVESEANTKTTSEEKVVESLIANLLKAKGGGAVPKTNKTLHRKVKDLKLKSIEDFCNQISRLASRGERPGRSWREQISGRSAGIQASLPIRPSKTGACPASHGDTSARM